MKEKRLAEELKKENEESNEIIAKHVDSLAKIEKALGLAAIKMMKSDYKEAPIPVLKNIIDWLDQILREKSGRTVFSRVELSKETNEWFEKNMEKLTEPKGPYKLIPYGGSKKK